MSNHKKELHQGGDIVLGSGLVRVDLAWPEFKKRIDGTHKKLNVQHVEDADRYRAFAVDDGVVYVCELVKAPEDYEETFTNSAKITTHNTERTDFVNNFLNKSNKSIKPTTSTGAQKVSLLPTEGIRTTIITYDWCDKTTWYQQATRVVNATATCDNPGTYTIYSVAHTYLIDTYHGKLSQEDFLVDANGHSYRVVVKVNGVTKTEQDPHYGTGGDYTINYVAGKVTFLSALASNDVVTVTYHHANGSELIVKPLPGKRLKIKAVEVQFSSDIVLTDSVRFQLYAGGYPYGDAVVYKSMRDYMNDANGAYPTLSGLGGNGWRGLSTDVVTFPWNYLTVTELIASIGMEIRIKLDHDTPFGGTYATATFYCMSEDE